MTDLTLATQDAVFAALSAGGTSALAPVYQHVPENTQPPAVIVGDIEVEAIGGKDGGLDRNVVTIVSFYRGPARKGLYAIMAANRAALDDQPLASAAAILSRPVFLNATDDLGEDGETYQGVQQFEIIAQPIG